MPHHAKHHASENRKAIERSLVTGTRGGGRASERVGCDCEEGEVDITTDPLRGSYCVNIAYHQAARPCKQGHLHGVSHHLASPMPAPPCFCFGFLP